MTFTEIEKQAQNAHREIWHLTGSARENAQDTIYVERAADPSEEEKIAMGSLESLLSYYTGPKFVLNWFARRGVRW